MDENIQWISRQVDRLSGLRFQWPSFPDWLEGRFETDTATRRCRRLWLEGLFAIGMYNLFLVADHLASPTPVHFRQALVLRLGLITPLALLVNLSMLRRPNPIIREASIAAVSCLAGLTHLYLEANQSPVASALAQFGMLAVIVFTNTVMRLRFRYALAATATMLAGDITFLTTDRLLSHDQKLFGFCLILGIAGSAVIANYSSNREERLNYLLYLRGEMLAEDLRNSNRTLTHIAEEDVLTGLPNRLSFETRFEQDWKTAARESAALSMIMVDLDGFKVANDEYGHGYGDLVLQRIAQLITASLRMKSDFAARLGGDEFVVLLPSTTNTAAVQIAERLRHLVEKSNISSPGSSTPQALGSRLVTVCCGVATASPTSVEEKRQHLLEAADKALYQAKREGRNCVRS